MDLNLFIIGPSGCGKSTQAKKIASKYNLTHLSMGDILRQEIELASQLGLQAKSYIDHGKWVPDDLVFDTLRPRLEAIKQHNFIVDGFPRVLNQGRIISHYLNLIGQEITLVIHLDVTFEEIVIRRQSAGNNFQDKSRTDNTPQAIASRQQSYQETIDPVLGYFGSINKLLRVNGNRPIEPIYEDICSGIDTIVSNPIIN